MDKTMQIHFAHPFYGYRRIRFILKSLNIEVGKKKIKSLGPCQVFWAKQEMGYNMMELQGTLNRDISVVSRLASLGEMSAERKIFKSVRERLNA